MGTSPDVGWIRTACRKSIQYESKGLMCEGGRSGLSVDGNTRFDQLSEGIHTTEVGHIFGKFLLIRCLLLGGWARNSRWIEQSPAIGPASLGRTQCAPVRSNHILGSMWKMGREEGSSVVSLRTRGFRMGVVFRYRFADLGAYPAAHGINDVDEF